MEYDGHGFLEELVATTIPIEMSDFDTNKWSFGGFDESTFHIPSNFPLEPLDQSLNCSINEFYFPFGGDPFQFSAPGVTDTPPFPTPDDCSMSMVENEEKPQMGNGVQMLEFQSPNNCKLERIQSSEVPVFDMVLGAERKNRVKKVDGQPSKNLMAERRRRKRLNDRLSMLRSVVPKISKMDRTSILGDTIDYMKELLDRINNLQEEIHEVDTSNQFNLMSIFKDVKPNEVLIRNSPKFDVERKNMDTRIDISCVGKPGLLLSTVSTLEALGLEIQQCVISCFNDFAMQATCSEELEQRAVLSSEDIKEALFRNAGYGGRCL